MAGFPSDLFRYRRRGEVKRKSRLARIVGSYLRLALNGAIMAPCLKRRLSVKEHVNDCYSC